MREKWREKLAKYKAEQALRRAVLKEEQKARAQKKSFKNWAKASKRIQKQKSKERREQKAIELAEAERLNKENEEKAFQEELGFQREMLKQRKQLLLDASRLAKTEIMSDLRKLSHEAMSIIDERGSTIPYDWNPAQEKFNSTVDRLRKEGRPGRVVILKTRRAGFTTGTAGRFFPETALFEGQNTLIVAHEYDSVKDAIYPMYHRFQQTWKPVNGIELPKPTSDTQQGITWENSSTIRIATAKNLESARSFGYRRVHLSEFAFYPNADSLLKALLPTVPRDPETLVVIESTANGVGGTFYDICMEAMDPSSESEWEFIFFGCFDDPKCSMTLPPDLDRAKFESSLGKDSLYNSYLEDGGEEVVLRSRYNLTLEQLYWRRWTIINVSKRSIDAFNEEYPHSPEVAFLTSGRPALDRKSIARYIPQIAMRANIEIEVVNGKELIMFKADPLGPDGNGPIQVWRQPQKGREYVCGSDTASGIDRSKSRGKPHLDFSCAHIFDLDTGEQCAMLRGRMYEHIYGQLLAWLCMRYNNAFIVPEVQANTYGRATLDAILREDYPRDRIYHRHNPRDPSYTSNLPRYDDLGWETNTITRGPLISALNTALIEHSITIYDQTTINECQTFIINSNGKAEAQVGCHDDCVTSLALTVIGIIHAPRTQLANDTLASQLGSDQYTTRVRDRVAARYNLQGSLGITESENEWRARKILLGDN